jgi:hypothetical protein
MVPGKAVTPPAGDALSNLVAMEGEVAEERVES